MVRSGFSKELVQLQGEILKMGTLVDELVYKAVKSMIRKDEVLAREVIATDDVVDDLAMEIERRCLSLIALQRPMAKDLRVIGAALPHSGEGWRSAEGWHDYLSGLKTRVYKTSHRYSRIELVRTMLGKSLKSYVEEETSHPEPDRDERIMDTLYERYFANCWP